MQHLDGSTKQSSATSHVKTTPGKGNYNGMKQVGLQNIQELNENDDDAAVNRDGMKDTRSKLINNDLEQFNASISMSAYSNAQA